MNSFLLVLCSLAVAFSANINYVPRGLSIRATESLAQTLTGSRYMKRHHEDSDSDHDHDHEESAEHLEKRQSADAISTATAALKAFFASLKTSLDTVVKSSSASKPPSQAELDTFFSALLQAKTTLQSAVGSLDSVGGMNKEDLNTFFTTSTENITKLKLSLKNAGNKPEAVNGYFTALGNSLASLQGASAQQTFDKSTLAAFFINLNAKTTKLEAELAK